MIINSIIFIMILLLISYFEIGAYQSLFLFSPEIRYCFDNGFIVSVSPSFSYAKENNTSFNVVLTTGIGFKLYSKDRVSPSIFFSGSIINLEEMGKSISTRAGLIFFIYPWKDKKESFHPLGFQLSLGAEYFKNTTEEDTYHLFMMPFHEIGIFYSWR